MIFKGEALVGNVEPPLTHFFGLKFTFFLPIFGVLERFVITRVSSFSRFVGSMSAIYHRFLFQEFPHENFLGGMD